MIKYLFLFLFTAVTLVHLYFCWMENEKARKCTKPLLIFFLILYYVTAADKINPALLAALVTSWIGDILLIFKGNKWFVIGGISFLISHILFIFVYSGRIGYHPLVIPVAMVMLVIYLAIALVVVRQIKDNTPRAMVAPMYGYLVANSLMNCCAMLQFLSNKSVGTFMALIGAMLFYASDCILYLVRYHKNKNLIPKRQFLVMITYLSAQFLITAGMLLTK